MKNQNNRKKYIGGYMPPITCKFSILKKEIFSIKEAMRNHGFVRTS